MVSINWDRSLGTLGVAITLFALFVVFFDRGSFFVATILGICMELMLFLSFCFLLNLIPENRSV